MYRYIFLRVFSFTTFLRVKYLIETFFIYLVLLESCMNRYINNNLYENIQNNNFHFLISKYFTYNNL